MRIALFGGSFNPPHWGHVEICRWLLTHNQADEILVVPCFLHPFGKELASFEDRLAMCRLAFSPLGKRVRISDVEGNLGGTSYTVKTIEHLKTEYPNETFLLVIGADVAAETEKWEGFSRIKELVRILSLPRGASSWASPISSTDIREAVKEKKEFGDLLPKEVGVYIITHDLY